MPENLILAQYDDSYAHAYERSDPQGVCHMRWEAWSLRR